MSFLVRQTPNQYLAHDEIAMPLAGLFIKSPITQKICLLDILNENGVVAKENAYAYFKEYCLTSLQGILSLFLEFGFVIEAHQQNVNLILDRTGHVKKLLCHDLTDNLKIYQPIYRLNAYLMSNDELFKHVDHYDDSLKLCVSQLYHGVFFHNMFPLAYILSREFKTESSYFLKAISETVIEIFHNVLSSETVSMNQEHVKVVLEVKSYLVNLNKCMVRRRFGKIFEESFFEQWFQFNSDETFNSYDDLKTIETELENPLRDLY